ncbi:MAG: hypothetical protein HQK53_05045 [Oligoflexia bacterium]|nr:hypothetical protein [Oligoflexia bacterium]
MSFICSYKRNGRTYLAEVENQRDGVKVKQKFIHYLGPIPEKKKYFFPQFNKELLLDGVKIYGSIMALDSVARPLDLRRII